MPVSTGRSRGSRLMTCAIAEKSRRILHVFGEEGLWNPQHRGVVVFSCACRRAPLGTMEGGSSPVGALPPAAQVELLGALFNYLSKPTGVAGQGFAPSGFYFSSELYSSTHSRDELQTENAAHIRNGKRQHANI